MKRKTSEKIIEYIKENEQASGAELSEFLNISDRGIRKQLKELLEKDFVYKVGKPPKVFYSLKDKEKKTEYIKISKEQKDFLEENYITITPRGEEKKGIEGFTYWCGKYNLNTEKTLKEYIKTLKKYEKYKKDGIIDGTKKIKNTFEETFLEKVYFVDFYSIERFGKTKLGQLLLYGKQTGDRDIVKKISKIAEPKIKEILKKHKIEAIAFIPWTVKRPVQLLKEFERNIDVKKEKVLVEKIKTKITIPQKTLNKIEDRIENAKDTIFVKKTPTTFKSILLIDDAVGSGATLNETAKKIKKKKIAKKVFGFTITGSFKGFDVISEV